MPRNISKIGATRKKNALTGSKLFSPMVVKQNIYVNLL